MSLPDPYKGSGADVGAYRLSKVMRITVLAMILCCVYGQNEEQFYQEQSSA